MPDRYWVGGTADWDGTAGTKWSTTSGGAGGASVPTTADDVFFTNLSTGTCTILGGNTGARSINCTGFAGTIAATAPITVAGSVTLVAAMTYTALNTVTFTGTGTLTTAGKTFSGVTVDGAGITLTLGDALNLSSRTITLTQGTFNTAGFNVVANSLVSTNSLTREFQLGSSTVTLSSSARAIDFRVASNFTFTAGTSQINITNANATVETSTNITFHNLAFTSASVGTRIITGVGAKTYNNLSLTAGGTGLSQLFISTDITVNGTFTCAGSSAIARAFVFSDATRTITAAAISANDCDFRDITLAGAAAGASPTRAGDCGGNSGITFPAAKTVYRVGTNTAWSGSSSWALTSSGTGSDNNFPLAQDAAIIDNNTALTGTLSLVTFYNISALDCSTRTTGITLDHSVSVSRYGSYILGSGVTVSGTGFQTFSRRSAMDFNSAGKTLTFPITVDAPGGTLRLLGAATFGTTTSVRLSRGTLDLNSLTLTSPVFFTSGGLTRTLAFGTGNITLTGTSTVWSALDVINLTVTGTPIVNVTNNTATATSVTASTPSEANSISFNFTAGTYSLTLSGNVRNLNFTGHAGTLTNNTRTIFGDLTISTGMTLTAGTSITTFASTSGTARTIRTNGKTFDFPLTFDGVGGTFRLLDALTMGSTRTLTHANGTLNLNGFTLSAGASYTTAAGTKDLTFNNGTLVCPAASTTAFNNANPSGFTTTQGFSFGFISMTAATAKTFVGGGSTFLACELANNGAGALTIEGSNTFLALSNSVRPTSFLFTAGTVTTLTDWFISGTAGNLVTINSTTGAQHTLFKSGGTVTTNFLSITNSFATGGAIWNAGANSVNGGNNVGWFGIAPPANSFLLLF